MKVFTGLAFVSAIAAEPTETVPSDHAALQQNRVPYFPDAGVSDPGVTVKRVKYAHPETGEQVTGYRRVANAVMYRGTAGIRFYSPPLDSDPKVQENYEASFRAMMRTEGLVLVPRSERRDMWKAERKKKKAAKRAA